MTMDVGRRVVCIDVDFTRAPQGWLARARHLPQLRAIYTIRSIFREDPLIGFCLEEIVNPLHQFRDGVFEPAFDSRRFRPVKPADIGVLKRLLVQPDETRTRKADALLVPHC